MAPREARRQRRTAETEVTIFLRLDGRGEARVETGIGFLDHMLHLFAFHGLFDLEVQARGDLHIDPHHTVEDVAIVLGQALDEALGDRKGIVRLDLPFGGPMVGALPTSLIPHFLESLAVHARMNLHARLLSGRDDHHRAEALFKALGRALEMAVRLDPRRGDVPSTKGTLSL
jgi:imidazoleglycerol-phosphate dehydratase